MTVRELRDILNQYPDGLPVLVDGYEGGFDNIVNTAALFVAPNSPSAQFEGEWQAVGDSAEEPQDIRALILSRGHYL